jgi:DNA (cytosine-5)-methyltransferase 1
MALRSIELCAGYGGFTLGLRDYGIQTVAYVERDSYAAATLVARMEEERLDQAPIWDDLCTFDGTAWRGHVDLITAGFPCQPFSTAGKQRGLDDDRWIWPNIAGIIADVRPRYVFLENVTGLIRAGLAHVLKDLAALGFDAEWGVLSAAAVGAPHRRQRVWILADAESARRDQRRRRTIKPSAVGRNGSSASGKDVADADDERHEPSHVRIKPGRETRHGAATTRWTFPPGPDDRAGWERWTASGGPQPAIRRGPDGRPEGLADALHLGGNGLVPQAAAEAFRQLYNRGEDQ